MNSFKKLLGRSPSLLLERRLASEPDRSARAALVEYANQRPNWFSSVNRAVLARTEAGFDIWCDRLDVIGQSIIATGFWEPLISRTIQACLRPGDVCIDVGANMGYDSMVMSTAVGAAGMVFAFEPDRENLLLLKNLQLLRHSNVVVHSCGLGDAEALLQIHLADATNRGTSHLRPNGGHATQPTQPLLVTRLDRVLPFHGGRIRLIKLDIEGYEHKALVGAGELLSRTDFVTCEVNRGFLEQCGSSAEALFDMMQAAGFRSLCAQPNSDDAWFHAGPDYAIGSRVSHHFDVLFYRDLAPPVQALVKHDG